MTVLVTGGAGYIGSHTCVSLLEAGHEVVVLDNLSNSSAGALRRVAEITGREVPLVHGDIRNKVDIMKVFEEHDINAVIHFAGLKAIGESVADPLNYYANNVTGSINLCEVMDEADCRTLVFSSSAAVYGERHPSPITEDMPPLPINPYGRNKLVVEEFLRDLHRADNRWRVAILRYFNPVGAHESGLIGEEPSGIPGNLVPFISRVAAGRLEKLVVFGADYDTTDGTGVRDYIHVMDLAEGHLDALGFLERKATLVTLNLGTGRGYSVLEMVRAFERATGKKIPYEIGARRPGDVAICYANTSRAVELLGWKAGLGIEKMCEDAWRRQNMNSRGFTD
jgi:UDP-glucose 4-epimerase